MHCIQLDHLAVAGPLISEHALNIDDMAAMNADEQLAVESRFDVADGEGTEKLVVAVEDVSVMRVGVDRHYILHGDEMRAAVAFDGELARGAPWRRGDTAERRICSSPQFGTIVVIVRRLNRTVGLDRDGARHGLRVIRHKAQETYSGDT